MRWDELFADLERQADAWQAAEQNSEVAERTRIENAKVAVLDRLRAQLGQHLGAGLADGTRLSGTLTRVGADFVLLVDGRTESLVPVAAIARLEGLGPGAAAPAGEVAGRLALRSVVRALARDRSRVRIGCSGSPPIVGTPGRVGADYVEVSVHPADSGPRPGAVQSVVLVPFANLIVLTRMT